MSENSPDDAVRGRTIAGAGALSWFVVALCWVAVIFDGYDLIVYGAVIPFLLDDPAMGLGPAQAGVIGSLALVGMFFGALIVGTITDQIGRRKSLMICASWFSVCMGLSALAPNAELLGLFRFLAGLGLGGTLPTAAALTNEYAPARYRTLVYAFMFSGVPLGGVLAASLSILLEPIYGWRVMFWIGVVPLLVVVPLVYRFVPESVAFLLSKDRREEAETIARRYSVPLRPEDEREPEAPRDGGREPGQARGFFASLSTIFSRRYVAATILFWLSMFSALLMIYGLNTWLPEIMRSAGYPLGSAITFLLVLNLGAIAGSFITSAATDRFGSKPMCVLSFLLAFFSLGLLSLPGLPTPILYGLLVLAGVGSHGTQVLLIAYISGHHPASSRATALGWSFGMGRLGGISGPLIGGFLVGAGLTVPWGFYAFALPGLVGAIVVALVPRAPTEAPREVRQAQQVSA